MCALRAPPSAPASATATLPLSDALGVALIEATGALDADGTSAGVAFFLSSHAAAATARSAKSETNGTMRAILDTTDLLKTTPLMGNGIEAIGSRNDAGGNSLHACYTACGPALQDARNAGIFLRARER
jgi:hypothetical protein